MAAGFCFQIVSNGAARLISAFTRASCLLLGLGWLSWSGQGWDGMAQAGSRALDTGLGNVFIDWAGSARDTLAGEHGKTSIYSYLHILYCVGSILGPHVYHNPSRPLSGRPKLSQAMLLRYSSGKLELRVLIHLNTSPFVPSITASFCAAHLLCCRVLHQGHTWDPNPRHFPRGRKHGRRRQAGILRSGEHPCR